jgi:hypothetical protein
MNKSTKAILFSLQVQVESKQNLFINTRLDLIKIGNIFDERPLPPPRVYFFLRPYNDSLHGKVACTRPKFISR